MAASINNDIQIDNELNSQPEPSVNTSNTSKRSAPESPDQLPATQKQTSRQTRKRNSNSISDLRDIGKKTPVAKRNTNVTDKILETLTSPDVLDKIVPVLAEKIGEALTPLFEDEIKKCIENHVAPIKEAIDNQQKNIDSNKEKICKQYTWLDRLDKQVKQNVSAIQEHDAELESLYKKIA